MLDLRFFRAAAVLLVLNSHLDALYEHKILGFGGAFGNSLFFFQAGYLLALSVEKRTATNSTEYFAFLIRRTSNLLFPAAIVTLAATLLDRSFPTNATEFFRYFIWPTRYWFVGALVIFQSAIYFAATGKRHRVFIFAIAATFLELLAYSQINSREFSVERDYFRWIHYFIIMTLGIWAFRYKVLLGARSATFLAAGGAAIFIGAKLLLFRHIPGEYQFILIATLPPFSVGAFYLLTNEKLIAFLDRNMAYGAIAGFLAPLSLEFYLVQVPIIHRIEELRLPNIVNVAVAVSLTCLTAFALGRLPKNRFSFSKLRP